MVDYINEGIDRLKQVITELNGMGYLISNTQTPYVPSTYISPPNSVILHIKMFFTR